VKLLRIAKLALSAAALGIAVLMLIPLLVFLLDSARNPELLRYEFEEREDPPRLTLLITYEGRVFLSDFNIRIVMSDGSSINTAIPRLEGGSSHAIDLPLSTEQFISPVEIKVSFRIAGLYPLEVDVVERR
jgi:hypothetical protein